MCKIDDLYSKSFIVNVPTNILGNFYPRPNLKHHKI
nr:MAG TPA: hypothetical protein [Caudoviricetes sp.]